MAVVPPARSNLRTHALAYLCLAALFLISVTEWTRDAFDRFEAIRHGSVYAREPFELIDPNRTATSLAPEAQAAGLKEGDVVLAVNGRPVDGSVVYYGALRRARVGDRLLVRAHSVAPDGSAMKDLSIALRPMADDPTFRTDPLSVYIYFVLGMIAMPVVCTALGFWVAAVRITDRSAWLLLVLLLSFPAFVGGGSWSAMFGREDILQPLLTGFHIFFANIASSALVLFGIAFPERLAIDRRVPWLKWVLFGPLMLWVTGVAIVYGLAVRNFALALDVQRAVDVLNKWTWGGAEATAHGVLHIAAVIVCFGSLGYKTVTASSRDARRRLLLLDVGAAVSVAALIVLLVVIRGGTLLQGWATFLLLLMVLVFPLTMAYAIVVHRAMDVRVVIRQGVQYTFARGGIRVIQLALTVAVSIMAASLLSGDTGMLRLAAVIAGMAAIVALGGRFADRLRTWVDRRFFREAYEADAILSDLASRVRTMVETGPLLETVATRIAESLHVRRIAILLNERGTFRPAYALGYTVSPSASISEQSPIVRRLQKQQHAVVRFDDADSWVQLTDNDERASLEQLKSELLLPLSLNEKVLGVMSLGPKQSEEPFSKTDLRLLDSVAAQTGLALENGRLTEAIKLEVAAREKHKRELEIAHEVQERLFPQEYPLIPGLDYAGACRPALGVGGDYYDFILLSKTELGIAIGDVSGKGIPAALLMATLRAYLRGQTIHRQRDLTAVMATLNRLVYESSAANRYATFFYAEFDAASRALNFVNAGHNSPMVFRQTDGGREVLRLDTGGPVIGLMEGCCYRQGRVALEAGDVLVAYTDGISEAMNAGDDEWGDERLMDAVRANPTVAARALIDRLMTSADAFVAGAPQHDDMTLIVVRAI
jgi:sigma-B regulation protein RsbU (phosphoserine phosphatase)